MSERDGKPTRWKEYEINNSRWTVPIRYTINSRLGQGAFGHVCSATDNLTGRTVAIKKLAQPFASITHAKRVYRELKLLKHFDHDNIISLTDAFSPATSAQAINDLYFVTNAMDVDLEHVIRTQKLDESKIIFLTYQLLRAIKYLHSAGIIHRDIKPGNLVVDENCALCLIDFGLARSAREQMTGYIATRWYRAPEVIMSWMHYTKAVDIWSVGCILAEMFINQPLFPGSDYIDQLNRILKFTGYPSDKMLNCFNQDVRKFFQDSVSEKPSRVNLTEYFYQIKSETALDLIDKMLQLDPSERITCEEALKHPFLANLHDENDEPEGPIFDDSFEDNQRTINEWKEMVFNEIASFQQDESMDV